MFDIGGASVAPKPRTVAQTPDKKQKKRELPHWMEKLENSAGLLIYKWARGIYYTGIFIFISQF